MSAHSVHDRAAWLEQVWSLAGSATLLGESVNLRNGYHVEGSVEHRQSLRYDWAGEAPHESLGGWVQWRMRGVVRRGGLGGHRGSWVR
jgi:hypothetical protein